MTLYLSQDVIQQMSVPCDRFINVSSSLFEVHVNYEMNRDIDFQLELFDIVQKGLR